MFFANIFQVADVENIRADKKSIIIPDNRLDFGGYVTIGEYYTYDITVMKLRN